MLIQIRNDEQQSIIGADIAFITSWVMIIIIHINKNKSLIIQNTFPSSTHHSSTLMINHLFFTKVTQFYFISSFWFFWGGPKFLALGEFLK